MGRDRREIIFLSHVRKQQEDRYLRPVRGLLPEPNYAGTLILDLPASRTMTNTFFFPFVLMLHSYDFLLMHPEQRYFPQNSWFQKTCIL